MDINAVPRCYYANNIIPTKQIMKYLGTLTDAKLLWKYHIICILNKCNKHTAILLRVIKAAGGGLAFHSENNINLINSQFTVYGSMIYGSPVKRFLSRLHTVQDTCPHIMTGTFPPIQW
jgi:hypothetical protein